VCGQDIDGGVAVVGTTVFLPCVSGTVAVQASATPASLRLLWRSGAGGGPPIFAAGLVWSIGQDGTLYGLNPSTGTVMKRADIGAPANHFPTPSIGDGLLLAPTAEQVVAFSTPSSTSTPTSTTIAAPTTPHASSAPPATSSAPAGGLAPGVLAAIAVGGLAVVVGLWWVYRRGRGPRRRVS
jgi:hypothetical protein